MALDHELDQIIQDLVKRWLCHLLAANGKYFTPFRISGVLDSHIIEIAFRDPVASCPWSISHHSLVYGILLNLIDLLNRLVHLTQVLDDFNDDLVEVDIKNFFHFLF